MEYCWSQLPSSKLVHHCFNSNGIPNNPHLSSISSVYRETTPRTTGGLIWCHASQLCCHLAAICLLGPAKWWRAPSNPDCLSIIGNITGCVKCKFRKSEDHWFIIWETWNGIQSLLKLSQKSLLFQWTLLFLWGWASHHSPPAWKPQISATAIGSPCSLESYVVIQTSFDSLFRKYSFSFLSLH